MDANPTPYVDKTGTMDKPDPMNYVFLEFPRAMPEVALVGQFGSKKHARRGWATFEPKFGIDYHLSKVGRHYLGREIEGEVNHADNDLLHAAQAAWNALAVLENVCKLREQAVSRDTKSDDVRVRAKEHVRSGGIFEVGSGQGTKDTRPTPIMGHE